MAKIRILTFHFIRNNGAAMFCYSLWQNLQAEFPEADIEFLDYRPWRMHLHEILKIFKPLPGNPSFYWRRNRVFSRFLNSHLPMGKRYPFFTSPKRFFRKLDLSSQDCVLVAMDIWCLSKSNERAAFPDVYWLTEAPYRKVAYAVSAYKSNSNLINKHSQQISDHLKNFQLIGVRDDFTCRLVETLKEKPDLAVRKVPDPTFLWKLDPGRVRQKLVESGIDFSKPRVGVLLFGREALMKDIYQYFHQKGYQVIALSMHNRYADLNLGHILNPLEWANTFAHLQFCLTNRFHGTVFCLKSRIPFLSLQMEELESRSNCKILDLLQGFSLEDLYMNIHDENFDLEHLLKRIESIQTNWASYYSQRVSVGLNEMKLRAHESLHWLKENLREV